MDKTMKKIVFLFCSLLMIGVMLMPCMALAEGVIYMPTDFLTWEDIGTFAGAVTLTVFIVQAVKLPIDKAFGHIPTRYIVYLIALAVMLLAQWFINSKMTVETVCMCAVNAFLVQLAAMATYTELIERAEDAKLEYWAGNVADENAGDIENDKSDTAIEEKEPPTQGGAE